MDASPLKKLPAELLNRIYELALHNPNGITIILDEERPTMPYTPGALTATCREIRKDTLRMFYATNRFKAFTKSICFDSYSSDFGPLIGLKRWVEKIGADSAGYVRHLCLELGKYDQRSKLQHTCPTFGSSVQRLDLPNAAFSLGFTIIIDRVFFFEDTECAESGDLPVKGAIRMDLLLGRPDETLTRIHDAIQKEQAMLLVEEEKEEEKDEAESRRLEGVDNGWIAANAMYKATRMNPYRRAQSDLDSWCDVLEHIVQDSEGWREDLR